MADSLKPERRIWRSEVRADVDDELAFHLEMRRRDFAERGADDISARRAAAERFGDVARVAAACRRIDDEWRREQRRARMWTDTKLDVVYALRSLRKNPGFTIVAVLTLALGIGANTAIFSVINSVLLRPLSYRDADRIVFLWSSRDGRAREPLTPARLLDFRERMTAVNGVAGISQIAVNMTSGGDPERIRASSVSSNFFDILGVAPVLGDAFHGGAADDRAVVLGYGLWVRRFGGDRTIVGRQIVVNGTARTVAAVMPRDFDWPAITATPSSAGGPELWMPAAIRDVPRTPRDRPDEDLSSNRAAGYIRAVARLADGVTVEQAQHQADAIAARLGTEHPDSDGGRGATLVPLRTQFVGSVRRPLTVLAGAVVLVLAIACANVASLLLGRAASRRTEISVRSALGASRGRIVRQLLTEAVILGAAGAICGSLLAWWAQATVVHLSPPEILRADSARIDMVVLAFTAALGLTTGLLFGIVPALQISAAAGNSSLHDGGTRTSSGPRSTRTREALVAVQLAVAVVLLAGALLLLRSLSTLQHVNTGIDTHNLLTFDMYLDGSRAQSQPLQASFYDEVLGRIRNVPGVIAAGAAATLPIGGDDFSTTYTIEGRPLPPPGTEPSAGYQVVTPGYFATMGIPLIAGRDVRAGDGPSAPRVILVNRTLAQREWPGQDPIGRRLRSGPDGPWMTIVGVVGDIRHGGPASPPRPEFYQPHTQRSFPFMAFVVRTTADPSTVVRSIRNEIASLDPAQPISTVATMDEHLARSLSRPRFMSTLVAMFGALALVLSIVGIYGVVAYSVAQRTREIAIRMALGARSATVLRMVLSRTLWLVLAGVGAGLAGAAAATRVLAGLLFGVEAGDPSTLAGAAAALAIAAIGAGIIPAVRATRVQGAAALRS
jgi:putative ABC transport system permease protein